METKYIRVKTAQGHYVWWSPINATSETAGVIKPDEITVTVDENGTLSILPNAFYRKKTGVDINDHFVRVFDEGGDESLGVTIEYDRMLITHGNDEDLIIYYPEESGTLTTKEETKKELDKKVDKLSPTGYMNAYVSDGNGNPGAVPVYITDKEYSIPQRDANGTFEVGDPRTNKNPTPKEYVDNKNAQIFSRIADIETDVDNTNKELNKDINNLKVLTQNLLQTRVFGKIEMDNTSVIRQTADDLAEVLDDTYSTVTKIQGNTVKCENLIPTYAGEKVQTINGVTFTVNDDGTIIANGTATNTQAVFDVATNINIRGTFCLSGCPTGGGGATYSMQAKVDELWAEPYDYGSGSSLIVESVINRITIVIVGGVTVNNLVFKPMLNIGATKKPYFTGLKNAQISGIKSIGRNFFNSEILLRAEGWTETNGVYSGDVYKIWQTFGRSQGGFYGDLNLKKQVSISFWGKNSTQNVNTLNIGFVYTDDTEETVRIISTEWQKYTLVSNADKTIKYIYITFNQVDTVSLKEVCMKVGANEFDYEPYTENTMQLPQTVELGKWDYIENEQLYRRSRTIELTGQEDFVDTIDSGWVTWTLQLPGDKLALNDSTQIQCVNNKYADVSRSSLISSDMALSVNLDYIRIRDDRHKDVYEFKSYLAELYTSGDPLIVSYKLAMPISITDITFNNKYLVWNKGAEQMLLEEPLAVPTITNTYLIVGENK